MTSHALEQQELLNALEFKQSDDSHLLMQYLIENQLPKARLLVKRSVQRTPEIQHLIEILNRLWVGQVVLDIIPKSPLYDAVFQRELESIQKQYSTVAIHHIKQRLHVTDAELVLVCQTRGWWIDGGFVVIGGQQHQKILEPSIHVIGELSRSVVDLKS